MKCKKCEKKSVMANLGYCENHFIDYFEKTVYDTIKKYCLIAKNDKIVVAVSGGKDSISVLSILNKKYENVTALAIDEGINNYRDKTLVDLKRFCKTNNIRLKIISFKKEFKKSLDAILKENPKEHPCTVCGVLRRYLLNKHSHSFDVIVTGHNLDDEAQTIMMNLLKGQPDLLARLGPRTGLLTSKKFTKRVKPLYFLTEKEVRAYSFLKKFGISFNECPYMHDSYRGEVQVQINVLENRNPGTKINIIKNHLKVLPSIKKRYTVSKEINYCKVCKEPSSQSVCNRCNLLFRLKLLDF